MKGNMQSLEARSQASGSRFPEYGTDRRGVASQPRHPRQTDTYAWPAIEISRKIDMTEVHTPWRRFFKNIDEAMRPHGRALPLKHWRLVYFSADELGDMLTHHYGRLSHQPDDRQRRITAREVVNDINHTIRDIDSARWTAETALLTESPNLYLRTNDPDNSDLIEEDRTAMYAVEDVMRPLWRPGRFEMGREEGHGPYGIGLTVQPDSIISDEMREIRGILAEKYSFDSKFLRSGWMQQIQIVDTSPLPVHGMHKTVPGYPLTMPLQGPRAFMQ